MLPVAKQQIIEVLSDPTTGGQAASGTQEFAVSG
jgi:hypothetical protein